MKIGKEIKISVIAASIFAALFYLETKLPFFKKFLPVEENKLIIVLLNVNLLLILLLLFLITRTFIKAYVEKKRGIWGSSLKLKLITSLLFISIVPSFTLFVLASGFFQISMEKWFSQKVEDAIDSAYEVYESHRQEIFNRHKKIADYIKEYAETKISAPTSSNFEAKLKEEAKKGAYKFYLLLDSEGNKVFGNFPPSLETTLQKKIGEKDKATSLLVVTNDEGEFQIYATELEFPATQKKFYLFIADFSRIKAAEKLKDISRFQRDFKKSRAYKKLVKYSFLIPLSLVTIIAIFFSTWAGMKLASSISVPVERVKEGVSIIAKGKFDISLEDKAKDEIGTLVSAFNAMARQLKVAKEEIEEKRKYMEIILDNVATGILTTDRTGNVLLINRAAKTILGLEGEDWKNKPISQLLSQDLKPYMRAFLKEMKKIKGGTVKKDLKLGVQNKIMYLRASMTALYGDSGEPEGFIIAIDDITHIIQAERLSLWQEVAKKLAHEIKNPLTPIVLSAERLRRKFMRSLTGKEKEVVDEATTAIINSAEVIKGIVNDLTKLTHSPHLKKEEDLNEIVDEVMKLYQNITPSISMKFTRGEVPKIICDKDGIKRVLLNLITNSIKAIEDKEGLIDIKTGFEKETNSVYLEVADNGKGIPDEDKPRIFDPYFTKEKDGTGLGLAIVNSIVLEHNGSIEVENNTPKGTKFRIRLPGPAT